MAKQPTLDDIKYILDQLIQVRGGALLDTEVTDESDVLYQLTDDLQSMIEYFTDYFELEPR